MRGREVPGGALRSSAGVFAVSLSLLGLAGVGAGCALPHGRSVLSSGVPSVRPARRSVFHAHLAAVDYPGTAGARATASLELVFRDAERFEYRLVVRDADVLYRTVVVTAFDGSTPEMRVATDLEVRGAYVQVRGTGALARLPDGGSLLERLRAAPDRFRVVLRGAAGMGTLSGSVR